jgi:pantoate kinase
MNSAKAFAPGNISCVFVIRKTKNPNKSGSLGIGFTVDKGVTVTIKKLNNKSKKTKKNKIYFNNKKMELSFVDSVIKKLTKERFIVKIKSQLPLGSGFGISGASALATAYAVDKLLKLKLPKKKLAFIAHISEVENGTGLGDVVNQYFGGFLVKYESSYKFRVKKLPINNKPIYYKCFNKLDTKKIISNKKIKGRINKAGLKSLKEIKKSKKTLENMIRISKRFALFSGLLKKKELIRQMIEIEVSYGSASMIMLGNAIFSNKKFKGSKKLVIKDKCAYLI